MNETIIKELEQRYKIYLFKVFLKLSFFIFFLAFVAFAIYFFLKFYQKQELNLALALNEKKELTKKLEEAKIREQKAQFLQQKKPQDLEKKKIQITSHNINATSLNKKFNEEQSFEVAISLARFYMSKKDYKNSIFWSFKANSLDKNSKESWILFAEAKRALGLENEAQKVLKTYSDFYAFDE